MEADLPAWQLGSVCEDHAPDDAELARMLAHIARYEHENNPPLLPAIVFFDEGFPPNLVRLGKHFDIPLDSDEEIADEREEIWRVWPSDDPTVLADLHHQAVIEELHEIKRLLKRITATLLPRKIVRKSPIVERAQG